MTSKEKRKQRIKNLNSRFSEKYRVKQLFGRSFFMPGIGSAFAFAVDYIGTDCLVLEYAETEYDLSVNRLEDGDSFPMSMTEDEMFSAMLQEIKE